ncbi:hypothetical protein K0M31_014228 [Melipona bicolor]|uniref:Uncharacterized protein n=1 Tax=Melipona bicolor TaxID=60889 RepID=A0AA40G8V1_9HYME|nr:hypothetical protein K0M31_014228 [Melipona bicolor]
MARIKKRPHARSRHKMKLRPKPNISELVYKFLSLGGSKEDAREALRNYNITKCQFCKRLKRREEVLDCPNSRPGGSMANKRKDTTRNSKVHRVKRRQTSRDQTLSSCVHKSSGGEGKSDKSYKQTADFYCISGKLQAAKTHSAICENVLNIQGIKKMKRYIQKALDFGVESGYLIPKDAAYKVLRVSSDLMNDANYASRDRSAGCQEAAKRQKEGQEEEGQVEERKTKKKIEEQVQKRAKKEIAQKRKEA